MILPPYSPTMMERKLQELKTRAMAATPGEWLYTDHGVGECVVYRRVVEAGHKQEPAICATDVGFTPAFRSTPQQQQADMLYIAAAHPQMILYLLNSLADADTEQAHIRNLERRIAELESELTVERIDNEELSAIVSKLEAQLRAVSLQCVLS